LQTTRISFNLDNFYSIWHMNQLNEKGIFETVNKGKNFYVRFEKTNEKGIEAGIFLSPEKWVNTKSDNKVKSLSIDVQSGDYIFAGIQVKKDTEVTVKHYEEIIQKWQGIKQQIGDLIEKKMKSKNDPMKVKFVLFIFTEGFDRKTGKETIWNIKNEFAKEDVIVFFSDIKNDNFFT